MQHFLWAREYHVGWLLLCYLKESELCASHYRVPQRTHPVDHISLKKNIEKETIFSTHSALQFHVLAIPPYPGIASNIHRYFCTEATSEIKRQTQTRRDCEQKVACDDDFTALSITDLKLYFFLGETAEHEKGGRDNRHSRHIKNSEETQQHKQQRADQQNVLWDYTLGPLAAWKLLVPHLVPAQFVVFNSFFARWCTNSIRN